MRVLCVCVREGEREREAMKSGELREDGATAVKMVCTLTLLWSRDTEKLFKLS